MSLDTRIRREGEHVLVQFSDGGKSFVLQLEGRAAEQLGTLLAQAGRLADEWAQAERVARDSAILLRAGANFTLGNHPHIIEEAKKLSAWDSELRRFMPGGVKSSEAFGAPKIKQGPALPDMTTEQKKMRH